MKPGIDYTGVAVAFFCHNGKGKFVFHKRSKNTRSYWSTWDCGGGGVEFGETLEQAVHRELKEEYGCTGSIEETLHPNTFLKTENGITEHWIVHPFIFRVEETDVKIGEPDKAEELGWFSLDDLPSPLHPGVAYDVQNYKNELSKYSL